MDWPREKFQELKKKREEAIRAAAEERIKTSAQREQYNRRRTAEELIQKATEGDVEGLIEQLDSIADDAEEHETRPTGTAAVRDARGNTLLAIAAWKNQPKIVQELLTHYKGLDPGDGVFDMDKWKRRVWHVNVNSRDQKGWTAIQIAVFDQEMSADTFEQNEQNHGTAQKCPWTPDCRFN